jgi:ATP-dependent DNA helicase RecG
MDPSLEKLVRILDLEQRQGCRDRAVIGGLESFVARWRSEAGAACGEPLSRALDDLSGYTHLLPPERRRRVMAVVACLEPDAAQTVPSTGDGGGRADITAHPPAPDAVAETGSVSVTPPTPRADDVPALDAPVVELRGIGATYADHLARLGITTVRDLLYHPPVRHNDYSRLKTINQLRAGETATIIGTVWDVRQQRSRSGLQMLTVVLSDTTATIGCTFFNQPYLEREFRQGRRIVVSGRVEPWAGRLGLRAPEWEPLEREGVNTGRLIPVYPLTRGLTQRWLRRQIRTALDQWSERVADPLPVGLREREGLLSLPDALRALHFPPDEATAAAARRRLAFDELLVLQLWSRQRRTAMRTRAGLDLSPGRPALDGFVSHLPFGLTQAQSRAIEEIASDLGSGVPMSRLLQGDVGSGKTVVAAAAMAMCVGAGYQAALMVPTEILAEQHVATLGRTLASMGYQPFAPGGTGPRVPTYVRLVGGLRAAEKAEIQVAIDAGTIDIVVGTHAVIQTGVRFARLGLAVVDEQHRFGVLQRAELSARGVGTAGDDARAHVLIMTATPIPRTLAQAINADLDQSVIDELPPGRQPVRTLWLRANERERAYQFIRHRVGQGEQAYVVCPRVDDVDDEATRAAVAEHQRLSTEVFPDLRVGLIHGRLRPPDKEAAMTAFRAGDVDLLVATSVIEVGVDVPNATVMLIEGADRFGLAQLHQFRGRVGRGSRESVCLLLADDPSPAGAERLEAMTQTNDGLALADRDLALRGPGDYFGVQQSGIVDRFRFARLTSSAELHDAQRVAGAILDADPALEGAAWVLLRRRVADFGAGAERV